MSSFRLAWSGRFSIVQRASSLLYRAAPRFTAAWALLLVLQGLLPVALVAITRMLVDSLVLAIDSRLGEESLQPTLLLAALMAGVLLLSELLRGGVEWVRTSQAELIQDHLSQLVQAKAVAVDMAFYESPDYFDRFNRATSDAGGRSVALLESTGSLLQNGLTLVGMLAMLLPYGLWLPLVLIVSTLPALAVVLRYNRRYHRWWERTTQDRRWAQYYDVMLTHPNAAAEVRLFNLGTHFQAAYRAIRERLRGERLNLIGKQSLARLGAAALAMLISGGALLWLIWRAMQGALTLGDLALIYQAFNQGQNLMRSLLSNLGQIYTSGLFLVNLFEFLDLGPQVVAPAEPLPAPAYLERGIHFRQVTFFYPGSHRPAVAGCDLFIPSGQVAAIVGENGAGKSTLVKLLCRFYDPQEGNIELDGVDLRHVGIEDIWKRITVLFQNPLPYHATAGQNIALGDLHALATLSNIEAAARHAGADQVIASLPKGYDTLLGKWFADGVELSAGEWQRMALARAYFRRAPIVVLDEPTSFMDSWSEADWFVHLRELVNGRTALVITHRFTIAMRADVIHVMHQGRIVESGSHAELLTLRGHYAQSWSAQMEAGPYTPVPG